MPTTSGLRIPWLVTRSSHPQQRRRHPLRQRPTGGARQPDRSFHPRRWHRGGYLASDPESDRCRRGQGLWRQRAIEWFKVYAGDEACDLYGTYQYLPAGHLTAIEQYGVAIKGPLTTPLVVASAR